jgi:hypothetical protein
VATDTLVAEFSTVEPEYVTGTGPSTSRGWTPWLVGLMGNRPLRNAGSKRVMDRNDIVRDTYAHFGLALYQAQVLEHGIVNAMVYARLPDRHRIRRSEIDAFMGRQFEKTLGALLRELEKYVIVRPELAADLAKALRMRNHLAHEYFRERAATFMTNEGCLT